MEILKYIFSFLLCSQLNVQSQNIDSVKVAILSTKDTFVNKTLQSIVAINTFNNQKYHIFPQNVFLVSSWSNDSLHEIQYIKIASITKNIGLQDQSLNIYCIDSTFFFIHSSALHYFEKQDSSIILNKRNNNEDFKWICLDGPFQKWKFKYIGNKIQLIDIENGTMPIEDITEFGDYFELIIPREKWILYKKWKQIENIDIIEEPVDEFPIFK